MPLSRRFGEIDCDSTANQFAAQSQRSLNAVSAQSSAVAVHSQRSLSAVSIESQSMANPLRMRCKLISTNLEKKIFIFMIKKQIKLKKKLYLED